MKPSEYFLELVDLGLVPHGHEKVVYGSMLSELGFVEDKAGNYIKPGKLPLVFTAHLDTVGQAGPVYYALDDNIVSGKGWNPIGADDKAGISLILYLQEHFPEASYALFVGEEVGLVGAKQAAHFMRRGAWVLDDPLIMVSLDRKGNSDLVYHQLGVPTASYDFALWLGGLLGLTPAEGVFTDSAAFKDLIPHCLNLSVGYENPHTNEELQDLTFLDHLASKLLFLDWHAVLGKAREYAVWNYEEDWTSDYIRTLIDMAISKLAHNEELLRQFLYAIVETYGIDPIEELVNSTWV
ncbi:peptidase [Thermus phage P74-26]|uniref:Metal-dependent hydrolase n=1 Tax=Thermus phage P74-26 TaxID=2914007 RepID=A7XXM5_BP742|nr:peptidase [Thermus phage P74-26]ABU97004.1 metal-dependent hydrolase [Thermus phage P74-26]